MKLWFLSDNAEWDTLRYRYAAEQMLFTLFPDERAEYPAAPPSDGEENAVVFTLRRAGDDAEMTALLVRGGERYRGAVEFPAEGLDGSAEAVYHVIQRALKHAFYQAGVAHLGGDLPWGALTGVRPVKLPTRALLSGATAEEAERELAERYHVSPLRRRLAMDCAAQSVNALQSLAPDELSLYVGIPFCPSRCVYCSFVSAAVGQSLSLVEPFVDVLCREIDGAARLLARTGKRVRTVYIGGGTPTTLSPAQLDRLLTTLRTALDLSRCTEFTVEAGRPDTITPEKLAVLAQHGVGRVSVNPQSMDDAVLRRMGRPHTADDLRRAYAQTRAAAPFAVNMDLIAGLPGDSPDGFARSLREVLDMAPENITVHTLALKKGSRLMEFPEELPTDRAVEGMLDSAWAALRQAGYAPYYLYRQKYMSGSFENVGWAKPNTESLYNIIMMEELHSVLALGGGVTKLLHPTTGKLTRYANPKYPKEYIERADTILKEKESLSL